MGLQSDVIGFRFGFGYEKGKRTLRAMSNEQFNNLDEAAEQAIYKHHEATAINFFKLEIQNWTNLQKIIIEKSVEIEKMKANRTPSAFREIFEGFTSGFGDQQKQDASNFFSSVNNTILNLIGYFSGGSKTTTLPPSTLPPERPTSIAQVKPTTSIVTIYVWGTSSTPKISDVNKFFKKAWSQATFHSTTNAGRLATPGKQIQGTLWKIRHTFLITYSNADYIPSSVEVTIKNLADLP